MSKHMPDIHDTLVMLYITTPDLDVARSIGQALLEQKLVACINILPAIESHYWWEGEFQSASESAFIAKTQKKHVDAVCEAVKKLHPYQCPCIVACPIVQGEAHFLDWIRESTR